MAITLSHGGPTIYRSPAPSKQVLVGTIQGVVCIERDTKGPGWHVASRALTDKHIPALLIGRQQHDLRRGESRLDVRQQRWRPHLGAQRHWPHGA
jgi:hypothetical protein